jgi:Lar family restriction alleviation protein
LDWISPWDSARDDPYKVDRQDFVFDCGVSGMSELKPCPFCGGEAEATEYNDSDYTIMCKNCHAEIGWREKAEAIAAWNRRAAD